MELHEEQEHAVGAIICNGDMIFEVYEDNDAGEVSEGVQDTSDIAAEPDGTEACGFATGNGKKTKQNIIEGIVVDTIESFDGVELGEMVSATQENGETVVVYVDENCDDAEFTADTVAEERISDFIYGKSKKHLGGCHTCESCLKTFTRKSDLKRHQNHQVCSFKNLSGNACPVCESKFGQSKRKKPFVCGICDKQYSVVRELKKHFQVHLKTQRYVCDTCHNTFDNNDALKRHTITAHGDKEHACTICDKKFRFKCNLTSHLRVHSEARPFHCDSCEKGFKSACELKSHKYIHTNERPYGCQLCGKRFRQSGNLNAHLRVHRQERPYVCVVCGKGFVESGKLNRHFRIHTKEKPYSCGTCGKAFCDRSNLKAHMKIHQRDNNDVMVLMYVEEDAQADLSELQEVPISK